MKIVPNRPNYPKKGFMFQSDDYIYKIIGDGIICGEVSWILESKSKTNGISSGMEDIDITTLEFALKGGNWLSKY